MTQYISFTILTNYQEVGRNDINFITGRFVQRNIINLKDDRFLEKCAQNVHINTTLFGKPME